MHVVEQHPGNAAGKVHKIVIVFQLIFKGGIRQRAALADIVAGKQLLDVILEVGCLFGGHFHAAAAQHRGVHGGVQHMQDSLMNNDLHGVQNLISYKIFFCIQYSTA